VYNNAVGWADIGYSFLIGEDGRVYEGRGWNVVGAHTLGYNSVAFGFSIMGDFMQRLPNDLALTATQNIIACGVELVCIDSGFQPYHDLFLGMVHTLHSKRYTVHCKYGS